MSRCRFDVYRQQSPAQASAILPLVVLSVVALAGCSDEESIPLDPGGEPLYSAVYISRADLQPVARDTVGTGAPLPFEVTVFHQRATADTLGYESANVSLRLWAQDRLSPTTSDVRVLVADTTIEVSGLSGLITVAGTTDTIPACAGLEFFLFDVRLRNRPAEGAQVVLARESESARIEESGSC